MAGLMAYMLQLGLFVHKFIHSLIQKKVKKKQKQKQCLFQVTMKHLAIVYNTDNIS